MVQATSDENCGLEFLPNPPVQQRARVLAVYPTDGWLAACSVALGFANAVRQSPRSSQASSSTTFGRHAMGSAWISRIVRLTGLDSRFQNAGWSDAYNAVSKGGAPDLRLRGEGEDS